MADTSVKVFNSTDQGAPSLSGTAGALLAVLDACLVNGYSLLTAQSVAVSGSVATVSFALAHGFAVGRVLLVSGATPSALNGEKRVLSATANSLTFDATGISDGAASGTITLKMAPAGWSKPYVDTGLFVGVYRSTNPKTLGGCLRVDDSNTAYARVVGYEGMNDVNTGVGQAPTSAQVSGGFYWPKAISGGGGGARPWVVIADSLGFYLCVAAYSSTSPYYYISYFGDYSSLAQIDAYAWLLTGNKDTASYYRSGNVGSCTSFVNPTVDVGCVSPRSISGVGGAVFIGRATIGCKAVSAGAMVGGDDYPLIYPNLAGNGLIVSPVWLCETGVTARGVMPGLYGTPQNISAQGWLTGRIEEGVVPGHKLMHVRVGDIDSSGPVGGVWIDTTGPWR